MFEIEIPNVQIRNIMNLFKIGAIVYSLIAIGYIVMGIMNWRTIQKDNMELPVFAICSIVLFTVILVWWTLYRIENINKMG